MVLPLMVPSFIVCIFLSLRNGFMVYDLNLTLTKGGPFKSTEMVSMHVYEQAFRARDYGLGQAEAFVLFLLVATVTILQVYFSKKAEVDVSRLVTIVLDPGHGGEDPGAVGRGGSYEKNVTLEVAQRLQKKIDADPTMRAVLTRDADFFVPLGTRVAKARRVRADLFVSIHADAFVRPDARGSSVFVLSDRGATSSAARWLAQRENSADLIGGVNLDVKDPYLARTLLDLSQTATMNDSMKLGRAVLGELGGVNTLHKPHVEQAGFAVLKAPDIPSILVETAFISNPEEEKRLTDDAYQDKLADAILRGIRRYLAKNPPLAKSRLASL